MTNTLALSAVWLISELVTPSLAVPLIPASFICNRFSVLSLTRSVSPVFTMPFNVAVPPTFNAFVTSRPSASEISTSSPASVFTIPALMSAPLREVRKLPVTPPSADIAPSTRIKSSTPTSKTPPTAVLPVMSRSPFTVLSPMMSAPPAVTIKPSPTVTPAVVLTALKV